MENREDLTAVKLRIIAAELWQQPVIYDEANHNHYKKMLRHQYLMALLS